MDNNWQKDVSTLESHMAQMKKVLEYCKAGNSAESCILLAHDLDARRLGKVATDIIDACVPICQQLQRAASVKATRAKEEQKLMPIANDVTKVDDKMKSPSLKEVAKPDPDVFKKKDVDVPKENEENITFEKVVQRIDEKDTSLAKAVSSTSEFVQSSQNTFHPTPADATKTKKEGKMDLVGVVKENGDKSSSLEATAAEVIPIQTILENTSENTNVTIEAEPLDDVQRINRFLQRFKNSRSKATPTGFESANDSDPKEKEEKKSFVTVVEVKSPVSVNSTSYTFNPMEKKPQKEVQVEERVMVPPEKMGCVAGRLFVNVKRLESTYDVRVSIPPMGGNEVLLRGTAENVTSAKKDIIDLVHPTTLIHSVKKNYLFAIEGHRGKVMNELCKEYDVRIQIDKKQEKVSITGRKDNCEEALIAIKKIVTKVENTIEGFDMDWDV